MAPNNKNGTTYNLATSSISDGNRVWTNWGTLFIREGGKGGVLFLKQGDYDVQIGVFKRRPRSQATTQPQQ